MSRGLGRLERFLLAELDNHPRRNGRGWRSIRPADYAATPSELSALHRAAGSLHRKGLAHRSTGSLAHIDDAREYLENRPTLAEVTEQLRGLGAGKR